MDSIIWLLRIIYIDRCRWNGRILDSSYVGNFLYFQRKSVIEEIEALLDVS